MAENRTFITHNNIFCCTNANAPNLMIHALDVFLHLSNITVSSPGRFVNHKNLFEAEGLGLAWTSRVISLHSDWFDARRMG